MAKIHFDAATKGNPGRSACAIIIKENSQRYTFTHDLVKWIIIVQNGQQCYTLWNMHAN